MPHLFVINPTTGESFRIDGQTFVAITESDCEAEALERSPHLSAGSIGDNTNFSVIDLQPLVEGELD